MLRCCLAAADFAVAFREIWTSAALKVHSFQKRIRSCTPSRRPARLDLSTGRTLLTVWGSCRRASASADVCCYEDAANVGPDTQSPARHRREPNTVNPYPVRRTAGSTPFSRRALSTAPATPSSAAGNRATMVCWSGDGCGGANTTTPALSMETPHAAAKVPASSCKHSTLPPMRFRLFDAWAAVGNTATTLPTFLGNLSCKARAAASTPSTAPTTCVRR